MGALVGMALDALVRAVVFAAAALAALALGLAALGVAVIGAAAVVLALGLAALSVAFQAIKPFAFVLVRVACVVACVAGVAVSFGPVWASFGGDVPALLPAGVLLVVPVGFVARIGAGFGGLLLAGALAWMAGVLLPAAHPIVRALAIMVVVGAVVYQSLTGGNRDGEAESG